MTDWIKWDGGECPIPYAKAGEYEIKCPDGFTKPPACDAKTLNWENPHPRGPLATISSYRLMQTEQDWLEGRIQEKLEPLQSKYEETYNPNILTMLVTYEEILDLIKAGKEAKS